ncbi:hypothetical protein J9253_07545 [Thiothrix litoralis]|jgi:hypothetical protein|uniref:Uncharacterized protein n=1 Tax=Thiothrix litoralis TaxID=2891210 RepID=A0ABX7WZE4_9GAMM|nr:hypothetical protein [Thiothrix litoralis]QTR47763.1 hypothetical protein J9253_07545 [Thiothrix litoralis]
MINDHDYRSQPTYSQAETVLDGLEDVRMIVMLCVDALDHASLPELSHVSRAIDTVSENLWNLCHVSKDLQDRLYQEFLKSKQGGAK